jgi:hypothetical protein
MYAASETTRMCSLMQHFSCYESQTPVYQPVSNAKDTTNEQFRSKLHEYDFLMFSLNFLSTYRGALEVLIYFNKA